MKRNKFYAESQEKFDSIYTSNVQDFTHKMAHDIGITVKNDFLSCIERGVDEFATSPIEALFYIAYKRIEINLALLNHTLSEMVTLLPQQKVGEYFCDFIIFDPQDDDGESDIENLKGNKIVIELDGHNFHDKDEKQRRYEKKRDRFLQSKGFNVLHFTGKEVTENPLKVVSKCLSFPNDSLMTLVYACRFGEVTPYPELDK